MKAIDSESFSTTYWILQNKLTGLFRDGNNDSSDVRVSGVRHGTSSLRDARMFDTRSLAHYHKKPWKQVVKMYHTIDYSYSLD